MGGDRFGGRAGLERPEVELEDVCVVRRVLRANRVQSCTTDELHGGIRGLPKEMNRA